MGTCLPRADAGNSAGCAIIGLGNPLWGDDGIGLVVAERLYNLLRPRVRVHLLEPAASAYALAERLIGYRRAVIIDALVVAGAEVGTVRLVETHGEAAESHYPSEHTMGIADAIAFLRALGVEIPGTVAIYGIVIRPPQTFSETLTAELSGRVPEIVELIAAAEEQSQAKKSVPAGICLPHRGSASGSAM